MALSLICKSSWSMSQMCVSACVYAFTRSDCWAGQCRGSQSMCCSQSQLPCYSSRPSEGQANAHTCADTHTQIRERRMRVEISCTICLPHMWQYFWPMSGKTGTSIYEHWHTPAPHSDRHLQRNAGNADCNSSCWSHRLLCAPSWAGYLFLLLFFEE